MTREDQAQMYAAQLVENARHLISMGGLDQTGPLDYSRCNADQPASTWIRIHGPPHLVLPLFFESFAILWGCALPTISLIVLYHATPENDETATISFNCLTLVKDS